MLPTGRRYLPTLVFALLVLLTLQSGATSRSDDFDNAWRTYRNEQSHLEPAYRFPHSRCFRPVRLIDGSHRQR